MALVYEAWKRVSIDPQNQPVKHIWDDYMAKERVVYANILKNKTTRIEGTVQKLAEDLRLLPMHVAAFLDGIHEAVDGVPHPLDELTEETEIAFDIDFARLYKQMVAYKAEELYNLPEWDNIFTEEERRELYTEQKKSHTVVRSDPKTGRNDPCTCNSGKKYKKCCGAA
ncbi:MAG: SEC-C metal-binding domain-containing protein [Defluviitaleaceae bacterium]|nr:SEC-C metal-binding domain-containing protein [Defluviitaleaceae bacterium]